MNNMVDYFWVKDNQGWTKAIAGLDGTPNRLGNGRRVPTNVPGKGYKNDTLWVWKWDPVYFDKPGPNGKV